MCIDTRPRADRHDGQGIADRQEYLCKLALHNNLLLQGTGSFRHSKAVHRAMPAKYSRIMHMLKQIVQDRKVANTDVDSVGSR